MLLLTGNKGHALSFDEFRFRLGLLSRADILDKGMVRQVDPAVTSGLATEVAGAVAGKLDGSLS